MEDGFLSSDRMTREQLRHYLADQQDPMTGLSTGRWRISEAEGVWIVDSSWPVQLHFRAEADYDWGALGGAEPQSEALWKLGLGYLPKLLEESGDFNFVAHLVESVDKFFGTTTWDDISQWMTSKDHALATRLRTMCYLAAMYQEAGQNSPPAVGAIVKRDVDTVLNHPDAYLQTNNHGAMVAIGLIHSCSIFYPSQIAGIDAAVKHLERLLEVIFDDQGVVAENSPSYQAFWGRLLAPVSAFAHLWGVSAISSIGLDEALEQVMAALSFFTDRRGKLLPIGDTNWSSSPVKGVEDEVLFSARMGFATYARGETMLTFNCGHENYAHKHCDDTSITLSYKGVPLVLDGGFWGHDWNDPRVIYSKSQSAHSGLFLREFDDLHPGRVVFPGRELLSGSLQRIDDEERSWRGEVTVSDGRKLVRTVTAWSPTDIEICDAARLGSLGGELVARYLLPATGSFELHGSNAVVKADGCRLELDFSDCWLTRPARLFEAVEGPPLRGWECVGLGVLGPVRCLELDLQAGLRSRTRIRLATT